MAKESRFQSQLIDDIYKMFPGCLVLKNDATYLQGIPDLLILYHDKWAALECKRSMHSNHQPNQDWYVSIMDEMSFARFIYPENREEVLYDLQRSFEACR